MAAFVAAVSALSLLKGGLYIARHEGDMLHLLEILFRLERGELPHIDFMTPIGAFAFLPIHAFLVRGMGVDQAIHWAQSSVAIALLPAVWWTAWTRFTGWLAYAFGFACLVLVLALVHGETVDAVSISMHYNRWAWALAFIAVALSVLKPLGRPHPFVDGAVIGLCAAGLVMIKVTYAVAFAGPVLVAMLIRQDRRAIPAAVIAAALVAVGVSFWGGLALWGAYIGDLVFVAGSEIRPNPSLSLVNTLVVPAYLGGTLAALALVVLLRRAGAEQAGLLALLCLPAFAYVTYQNFANDPQWWAFFGILALMLRAEADEEAAPVTTRVLGYVAVALFALATPSFINLAYSPIRHAVTDPGEYAPLLVGSERHAGFQTRDIRAYQLDGVAPLDRFGIPIAAYDAFIERPEPVVFQGETLPACELAGGLPAMVDAIASDLTAAGFADGRRFFVADLFSVQWLYNSAEPLIGGAPWYYGGLPGWESADFLVVPVCPAIRRVRSDILSLVEEMDAGLEEVRRTPFYILYSIS
ncbi:MAG: hypothetical protein QNJ13_03905 [Paracoccaceae bacterium]|nr:hypothetical protein [Paracoccaceae bacterium]